MGKTNDGEIMSTEEIELCKMCGQQLKKDYCSACGRVHNEMMGNGIDGSFFMSWLSRVIETAVQQRSEAPAPPVKPAKKPRKQATPSENTASSDVKEELDGRQDQDPAAVAEAAG
jgi:ribosomal protein L37E